MHNCNSYHHRIEFESETAAIDWLLFADSVGKVGFPKNTRILMDENIPVDRCYVKSEH